MFPRLVLATLILAIVAGLGYGAVRLMAGPQPLPRAADLIRQGDPRGAQRILRPLLRNDPRNAEAHVLLARTQLDLHDPVAAERELKSARALRFDRATVTRLLARAYMMQGRWQDVLADIPAEAPGGGDAQNLTLRAGAYIGMGDLPQAAASIAAAARIAPGDPHLALVRARLLAARDDLPAALAHVDAALAGLPRDTDALLLRADLLARSDRPGQAMDALDQALGIEPYNVPARLQRAQQSMSANQDARARADIDAALEIDGHDTPVLMTLAMLQIRAGRIGDGVTTLQRLQASFEQNPLGYYYLALGGTLTGQFESASEMLVRFNRLRPGDLDGLRLQGLLDQKLGRPAASTDALRQVVRRRPADAEAWDLLGRALFMLGRGPEALAASARAVARDPARAEDAAHLAAARVSLGSPCDAAGTAAGLRCSIAMETKDNDPPAPAPAKPDENEPKGVPDSGRHATEKAHED